MLLGHAGGQQMRDRLFRGGRAQGAEQEQAGCARRTQHLRQERQRVGVGPLEIVDEGDDGRALAQRPKELAEDGEHRGADLARIRPHVLLRRVGDDRNAAQHRERLQQDGGPLRNDLFEDRAIHAAQHVGEHVDQTVECLERNQLPLVAAGGEQDRVFAARVRVQERAHQRRFADPRLPADDERLGAGAGSHPRQRGFDEIELGFAADEADRLVVGRGRLGHAAGRHRGQQRQHLGSRKPRIGIRDEQAVAERGQIRRRVGGQIDHPRRPPVLLAVEDLVGEALEGQAARQKLEQDHAERVPVGGRGHGLVRHLLRRHVFGGSGSGLRGLDRRGAHQPKVEQHRTPLRGDQDVRRLDVSVHALRRVQRGQRLGQLRERRPQPLRAVHVASDRLVAAGAVPGQDDRGRGVGGHDLNDRGRARGLDAPQVAQEIGPPHQLHREEPLRSLGDQLAEADQVGVANVGDGAELALEAQQHVRVHHRQQLQGHRDGIDLVERLIHHTHPTPTQEAHQPKARGTPKRDRAQIHRQPRGVTDPRLSRKMSVRPAGCTLARNGEKRRIAAKHKGDSPWIWSRWTI